MTQENIAGKIGLTQEQISRGFEVMQKASDELMQELIEKKISLHKAYQQVKLVKYSIMPCIKCPYCSLYKTCKKAVHESDRQ